MSIISVTVVEAVPPEFIRGQTLEFVMDLPADIPAGFWYDVETGVATTLEAQLRKKENAGEEGLISDLVVTWENEAKTKIRFKSPADADTQLWPIGPVEFDVFFTRTQENEQGSASKTYRSAPVRFTIVDGITRPTPPVAP